MLEYEVRFSPSFHDPVAIKAEVDGSQGLLSITSPTSSAVVEIPPDLIARFEEAIDEVVPGSIPSMKVFGLDGMSIDCSFADHDAQQHSFSVWSPRGNDYQRHLTFILGLYTLACDLFPEPLWTRRLESLHSYFDSNDVGLPIKDLGGDPKTLRIFGGLSSLEEQALQKLFASLGRRHALVVDMSNFESMGTILFPTFRLLARNVEHIRWIANETALHYLKALGIDEDTIEVQ